MDLYSSSFVVLDYWLGLRALDRPYYMLIKCYRLTARCAYDEEMVWALVQNYGGSIVVRSDCIDFWIHESWEVVLVLAFPDLVRLSDLDYVA